MRWLGLSGKTVIIDEAHAYDTHGHALTVTLLEWLGHLGVPVIVLSATLTSTIASSLLNAYRRGAGHPELDTLTPTYPGWTYSDHATGTTTTRGPFPSPRAHRLNIHTHTYTPAESVAGTTERTSRILNILQPLHTHPETPGAALIVCNTVADAQATETALKKAYAGSATLVRILHARMPVHQRHGITHRLERWTGPARPARRHPDGHWTAPTGKRPDRPLVVITTQVAEQSLDVDFDLVISDLAPFALLAQRAGRGHRHQGRPRPPIRPGTDPARPHPRHQQGPADGSPPLGQGLRRQPPAPHPRTPRHPDRPPRRSRATAAPRRRRLQRHLHSRRRHPSPIRRERPASTGRPRRRRPTPHGHQPAPLDELDPQQRTPHHSPR
ncbi:CRISPR-associated helicase Cas3' [Streptomyces sp. NPDC127061]|uniref:CRISPR-associated helicase Cas3' n=1 Tax=Streptomyces sp. NPDC127061 TaxID=3347122 RepID=UPI00364DAF43